MSTPPPPPALVARLRAAGCVFAEDEAALLSASARSPEELDALVERRVAGTPLEHVLGWVDFGGIRVEVDEGVFVPRRRTQHLAEQAVGLARRAATRHPGARAVAVDLCCGSGAVGAVLLAALPGLTLHAADVDPAAVRCARRNLGEAVGVHCGDLFAALPGTLRGRVDVLVANVPYVPTGNVRLMPPEARLHEPRVALDGGADGLDVVRRVAAEAPRWLAPGGAVLVETSPEQVTATLDAFARGGLVPRVVTSEEAQATACLGVLPGTGRPLTGRVAR